MPGQETCAPPVIVTLPAQINADTAWPHDQPQEELGVHADRQGSRREKPASGSRSRQPGLAAAPESRRHGH